MCKALARALRIPDRHPVAGIILRRKNRMFRQPIGTAVLVNANDVILPFYFYCLRLIPKMSKKSVYFQVLRPIAIYSHVRIHRELSTE